MVWIFQLPIRIFICNCWNVLNFAEIKLLNNYSLPKPIIPFLRIDYNWTFDPWQTERSARISEGNIGIGWYTFTTSNGQVRKIKCCHHKKNNNHRHLPRWQGMEWRGTRSLPFIVVLPPCQLLIEMQCQTATTRRGMWNMAEGTTDLSTATQSKFNFLPDFIPTCCVLLCKSRTEDGEESNRPEL